MSREKTNFLAGVIEGFYGPPWTQSERSELFGWMANWDLNTYLYAPKDDLKHRALWREQYSAVELERLREVVSMCKQRSIAFFYGLSPGLDIRYSDPGDLDALKSRFDQMLASGCRNFALLFDDIPDRMDSKDIERWGSLASAQSHVANSMFEWARQRFAETRLLFCPTPYCGRMVERKHGGENYLPTIGRELLPEIDVFWTGPEIISREITLRHIEELRAVLRRKPLIWDNLHANDYDGRRFYCGPYAGRSPGLREAVSGLLLNPNNEFPLNYVPLRTFAAFIQCGTSSTSPVPTPSSSPLPSSPWNTRNAYLSAIQEWLPSFATIGQPLALQDLVLFGDCYYLPHEEGPEAERLYDGAEHLLKSDPATCDRETLTSFRQQAGRLRDFCARLVELKHRPLFYALSRRAWELREELDLLIGYIGFKLEKHRAPFTSDFHLSLTYRGGMVARLQRLLTQNPDGTLAPR